MNEKSKDYYNYLLKKHSQNMELYKRHQSLSEENEQHRKGIEKFTDTNQDVFHHIWRD